MRLTRPLSAAVAASALLALVPVPAAARDARDARPTERTEQEYAVGREELTLVDRDRPTDANGTYPGTPTRTLPMLVLYPARGRPDGPTREGARAARRGGPFPLVVFSHGFTATGPDYERTLLRRIAARGYVVAAPTFPLTNRRAPGGPRLVDYVNQPGDVSFVIDTMLERARRARRWYGVVDRERVGVMGHSLGAITTLGVAYNSCCADDRIDAAVPMSGIELPFGEAAWSWPPVPLLLVHGDQDETVPYTGSTRAFAQAKPPKFLLTLLGAPHTPFRAPWLEPTVASIDDFFDRYLDDERRALARLERDGNVPGVSTLEAVRT